MRHHLFEQAVNYRVALLMKSSAFNKQELINTYVKPLSNLGLGAINMIAFTLEYNEVGKAPVAHVKEYLDSLLPELQALNVEYLYVADSVFFKTLTKQTKAEPHLGYVLPCQIKGFTHMKVVLGINYQQLIYNPEVKTKVNQSLVALASAVGGTYESPGTGIIHSVYYPETLQDIQETLNQLHQYPELSADIEAFSLRFNEAGIGTISFAWDEHNGIAFACDYQEHSPAPIDKDYGYFKPNEPVRAMLKEFFSTYKGKLTWHKSGYDVKVIIYVLWMKSLLDTEGLLKGLDIMCRGMDDTKIIAYLATNSTAGNILGLKPLAQEFAGNWAKDDIKDICKIPLADLLQYNLVDALSTNYVKNKHWPIMVQDNQLDLYNNLMMPSQKVIIQMELTGMPMNKAKIKEVKAKLVELRDAELVIIRASTIIQTMNILVQTKAMEDANAKLKVKQHPLEKFANKVFNPNSGPQLQQLLYELMQLPVLDLTDTKQPATGADTIEKLINHTQDANHKALLAALISYGKITKILNTFIPAFEEAIHKAEDGIVWLHGSFNLGGALSGRLSSSEPK